MAAEQWEKDLRKKLLDVLTNSFKENNSLSDELKCYAIKNHLLEDITNFIQNEQKLFDQKIHLCKDTEIQTKIDEIVNRKNYFFIGWLKDISYDLWQLEPGKEASTKWQAYMAKHKEKGEKTQTFYAHVESGDKMSSLVEINKGNTFCLNNDGGTSKKFPSTAAISTQPTNTGIVYVLEYSKILYSVLIAGDCMLNGIKARELHDIHKTDITVYFRSTTADLFKNYTKAILRSTADVVILHFGTYDLTLGGHTETVQNMKKFIKKLKEKRPHLMIAVSSIIVRVDRKGMRSSVKAINSQLKNLCDEEQIGFVNNDNVTEDCLCQKMLLTLNAEGKNRLANNMSTYIDNLL